MKELNLDNAVMTDGKERWYEWWKRGLMMDGWWKRGWKRLRIRDEKPFEVLLKSSY